MVGVCYFQGEREVKDEGKAAQWFAAAAAQGLSHAQFALGSCIALVTRRAKLVGADC